MTRRALDKLKNPPPASESVAHDRAMARLRSENAVLREKYKHACEELERAEGRAAFAESVDSDPNVRAFERLKSGAGGNSTAILCMSDWHIEEQVDPATISGLNRFDLKIAESRVKRAFQKGAALLDFVRGFAEIKELYCPLLGDLITGYLHEELEENNYLSPTEALLFVQDMVVSGLEFLLRECNVKRIVVPTSYGNHGRTTKKPRFATGYKNSYEWLGYQQMSRYFSSEPRIVWKVENGYHNLCEIQGRAVRFHHGDAIKFQGGVGGITVPVLKKIAQWNKSWRADLDVFGHFHQLLDHWNFVCCGCLVGYNAYALRIGADYQPPTQTLIVVSKKHGKVLAMPVFCE